MKPIIVDMKDMSDSTEVYNSRPNPFFVYFIYLLLGMLIVALCWMYFSKIDISVKSNGIFRSDGDIVDISNGVTGKVEKCNFSEGQYVNKGDILLTLSVDSINESIKKYQTELENINERIKMLSAYQKSLDGNNSAFEALKSNKYYDEFNNRRLLTYANVSSSDKDVKGQKNQYEKTINSIQNSINEYKMRINKLETVENCIKSRKNTFNVKDSYYSSIVAGYISNYDATKLQYDNQIKEVKNNVTELKKQLKASKDTSVIKELKNNIFSVQTKIKTYQKERKKTLKNLELQQIAAIEQQIETSNTTILSLQSNLDSAQAQVEALNGTDSEINENITILTEKENVASELLTYENKKTECENNLKTFDLQNGKCTVKASVSGHISQNMEIKQGSYVQEGTTICRILPETSSGYYAEVYVGNADIAKMRNGQKVKFEIAAYPSAEYGYFTGVVDSISKDIKVDESSGSAYYLVKVKCEQATVTNKEGKTGSIMNGMACQAKVVVDEENVLEYLLKKIELLD